jgi:hypothetical protein
MLDRFPEDVLLLGDQGRFGIEDERPAMDVGDPTARCAYDPRPDLPASSSFTSTHDIA